MLIVVHIFYAPLLLQKNRLRSRSTITHCLETCTNNRANFTLHVSARDRFYGQVETSPVIAVHARTIAFHHFTMPASGREFFYEQFATLLRCWYSACMNDPGFVSAHIATRNSTPSISSHNLFVASDERHRCVLFSPHVTKNFVPCSRKYAASLEHSTLHVSAGCFFMTGKLQNTVKIARTSLLVFSPHRSFYKRAGRSPGAALKRALSLSAYAHEQSRSISPCMSVLEIEYNVRGLDQTRL